MDKLDIRDQILRIFKEKGFDEQNCSFFKEEDIIEIAESIVENLPIYVVMQQRELLLAFVKQLQEDNEFVDDVTFQDVNKFLANNSA